MIQRGWGMIAEGYAFQPTTFGETFQYKLKASIDMTGGAMNWEGPIYWRTAAPEILRAIEAYDTAGNRKYGVWRNLFANTLNGGYYKIYTLRPDGSTPGLADSDAGQKPSWKDNFAMAILLDRFKDGHVKHFLDTAGGGWYGGYGAGLVFKLLFYDSAVRDRDYTDLPPAKKFGREIVARSGWAPTDTFLTFTAGSLGYYHNHLDENGFTIFREGDLATDGGYVLAEPYYSNYFKRTVAHNAITVFDPSECWRDATAACTLSNDGGQRWPLRRYNPPFQKFEFGINRLWSATVLANPDYREQFLTSDAALETRPEYDYIRSDATRAYSNKWSGQGSNTHRRVSLAQRELVFVRPDLVFVLDRVTSTNPAFQKSWLLHSVNAPRIGTVTPPAGITDYPGSTEAEIQNGGARMFVKTLLPEHPRLRVIGGAGYEGWVNGKNYWTAELAKDHGAVGRWRLEVQPSQPQSRDLFLHFLHPGFGAIPAVSLVQSADAVGAFAGTVAVLFTRSETPQKQMTYRIAHSGRVRHVVAGLASGQYDVYRNGAREAAGLTVAAQATVTFLAAAGGDFAIVPAGQPPR
jgi:hypothetical protein